MINTWQQQSLKMLIAISLIGMMLVFSSGLLTQYSMGSDMDMMGIVMGEDMDMDGHMHDRSHTNMEMMADGGGMGAMDPMDCIEHCIEAVDEYRSTLFSYLFDLPHSLSVFEHQFVVVEPERVIFGEGERLAYFIVDTPTMLLTTRKLE